ISIGETWKCSSCGKEVPNGSEDRPKKKCKGCGANRSDNNSYGIVVGFGQLKDDDEDDDIASTPQILVKLLDHNTIQVACCRDSFLALTKQGEVYSWKSDDEWNIAPVRMAGLEGAIITHIEVGTLHFIALSSEGNIYIWGVYDHCDAGSGKTVRHIAENDDDDPNFPVQLLYEPKQKAKSISSGSDFCAALLDDNTMVTWGIGTEGQMARDVPKFKEASDEAIEDMLYPKPPLWDDGMPRKVLSLACGYNHLLVVVENHEVYSSGVNNRGQLGHGDLIGRQSLTKINALKGIAQVAAGRGFSYFVDQTGRKVSACGTGHHGQLGLPVIPGMNPSSYDRKLPIRVPLIYKNSIEEDEPIVEEEQPFIKQISCGMDHVLAITSNGDTYSWGKGNDGKCGQGILEGVIWRPKKLESNPFKKFLHVSAGFHSSLGVAMVDEEVLSLTKNVSKYIHKHNPRKIAEIAPILKSILE
ncbi:hypothetical protein ACHAWU_005102, partial [Discostella pseudostelligera]